MRCEHANIKRLGARNAGAVRIITLKCLDCGRRYVVRKRRRFYGDERYTRATGEVIE